MQDDITVVNQSLDKAMKRVPFITEFAVVAWIVQYALRGIVTVKYERVVALP